MLGLALFSAGREVLRLAVFAVFYPVTVPGMVLLSACGLYPCGAWVGMEGDDEEEDENYAKGMQLLQYIGITPGYYHLSLQLQNADNNVDVLGEALPQLVIRKVLWCDITYYILHLTITINK